AALMQAPVEVEYTSQGYLLLPAVVACEYFPQDVLVLMVKGDEVWMLPTRGAAAGGLLLKQRNAAGDRSLLAAPYLPGETRPGRWLAFWDERSGALRVAFRMPSVPESRPPAERAIAAKAIVEAERGRWVVYLDLGFSASGSADIRVERRRIADYPSLERARVAAAWIERSADRDLRRPNLGY
ncbi:MAG TPA: hypothetical protein VG672_19525, partial [Bryobacteraceae bacterium]|nr:hypothetical protein [Bryobacteraceae bacterium]